MSSAAWAWPAAIEHRLSAHQIRVKGNKQHDQHQGISRCSSFTRHAADACMVLHWLQLYKKVLTLECRHALAVCSEL